MIGLAAFGIAVADFSLRPDPTRIDPMSGDANSYDKIPYASFAFALTHPDRLASIATLLGLRPAPAESCRVLEIGCASGGNLIPMAEQLPNASFVGIDLSVRQVIEGQDLIRELGLGNIRIEHRGIMDVGDDFGTFDYIICHGVFSWVPAEVQDKILTICKRNLTPEGIAYVSYNTLPGWHMRAIIRDMMLFHTKQFSQADEQIRQARGILDFFVKSISPQNNPYSALLQSEVELLRRSGDSYLFHEHLETHNSPIYFFEFNRRAEAAGLRFLAEADMRVNVPGLLPKEIHDTLQRLSTGQIYLEQYMDFLRNRAFRQTLLCHADRQPNNALTPQLLAQFHVAAPLRPKSPQPNYFTDQPETFVSDAGGMAVTVRDPIAKSALAAIGEEWPRRISFHVLRHRARARLDPRPVHDSGAVTRDAEVLGMTLLQSYTSGGSGLTELSLRPLRVASANQERPFVSALNRRFASAGKPAVSLRHEVVPLGDFERHLILLLDGAHSRTDLRTVLAKLVRDGVFSIQKEGSAIDDEGQIAAMLDQSIDQQLIRFAQQSLLVAQTSEAVRQ